MDRRRAVLGLCILIGAAVLWLLLWERSTPTTSHTSPGREHAAYVPETDMHAGLRGSARDLSERGSASDGKAGGTSKPEAGDVDDPGAENDEVSLTIETVDGMTGRHVRGTWNLGTGNVTVGPFPPDRKITDEDIERQRVAASASKAAWERAFLRTGEARASALAPGKGANWPFVARLASGYVLDDPYLGIRARVAAGVTRAHLVLPVWPEAVLDLTVFDPEGQPATGVRIERIYAAGRLRNAKLDILGPGRYRVRGIPRMAGEVLRAVLLWSRVPDDDSEDTIEVMEDADDIVLFDDLSTQSPQINTVIPADPSLPWHVHVDFKKERHAGIVDSIEFDNDLEWEESLSETDAIDADLGRVRVRALGSEGKPIVGADLFGQTTNAEGVIRLERYTPGKHTFEMRIPGHLPATATVTVEANKTTEVTLREPLGARLKVYVSDAAGRPRPSALLHLAHQRWFDVDDGVQRLDLHTNANGRRTLSRVQPGKFTLYATWGGREGEHLVELKDGETTTVHIITK